MKTFMKLTAVSAFLAAFSACTAQKTLTTLQLGQQTPPPQITAIQMTGYMAPTGRVLKDFFVMNFSVKAQKGVLQAVSARDGLPDTLKEAHSADYGFSIIGPNSANQYFSDLVLYLAGILIPQQSLLFCSTSLAQSTSNDALVYTDNRTTPPTQQFLGLRDCEKAYIGLNPSSFDFDGDGVPDYLELRCGMNPKAAGDAGLSITGDGVSNLEKCKRGIPVDESANSPSNQLFALQYASAIQADGTTTFNVTNIPILNDGLNNFLAFYLTEQDTTTLQTYLYTAYSILPSGSNKKTNKFPFWATDPTKDFNQEITFQ